MSRMKIDNNSKNEVELKLIELEKKYKQAKQKESEIKKLVNDTNEEIKQLMLENKLDEFGSLTLSATDKESFNELKAIEILRDNLSRVDFKQVVKTKEYIDDDALEKLAYNSSFDMSILAPCKTITGTTYTLRIKKGK